MADRAASAAEGQAQRVRLLIYARVPDARMLEQGFYEAEARGLRSQPEVVEVRLTNRLGEVWRGDYDGLIAYFYSYAACAALVARLRRRPAIATGGAEQLFRAMAPGWGLYAGRVVFFWLTLLFANRLLATSSSDYARMRQLAPFKRGHILLSFHGVDAVDAASPADFNRTRAPGSLVTICGMDTLENVRRKGVFRAVELLAQLRTTVPEARLTIIGRTTRRDLVEAHAAQLGVIDAVRFAGYVDEAEKLALLRSHAVYVQLSDYEGFGIGALEALALGCRVVHTNVGGLRDTVGELGIIVPLDQPIAKLNLAPLSAPAALTFDAVKGHLASFGAARRAVDLIRALGLLRGRSCPLRPTE